MPNKPLKWTVRLDVNGQQFEESSTDYNATIHVMARQHNVETFDYERPVPQRFIEKATGTTFSGNTVSLTVVAA